MKRATNFIAVIIFITFINFIRPTSVWAAATLSLSPASGAKTVNVPFTVDIVLDTGGDGVGGVTAILTYDTTKLQVQGTSIMVGTAFTETPFANTVDSAAGQIRFDSGSLTTAYTGSRGVVATIPFVPVAAGTAQVNFVYNPSSTTGTSLVAAATGPTNLLSTVNNGVYTISSTTTTTTTTTLLPSGAVENTLIVLAGGVIFIAVGVFLARKSILGA